VDLAAYPPGTVETVHRKEVKMRMRKGLKILWAWLLLVCTMGVAQAQTSASNLVALIDDNVSNATAVVVPLALGLLLLSIGIGAAMYVWRLKRGGR